MAIIKQHDKRSGITYVYESKSYWDPDKKQSRSQRKLIGKIDPETGETVPTDQRHHKARQRKQQNLLKHHAIHKKRYGATYLLQKIARKTGIYDDLRSLLPEDYQSLLNLAYYLVLASSSAMRRYPSWAEIHYVNESTPLSSQRISELFQKVTEFDKQQFFRVQMKRREEPAYWCYDTTSLSSYSESLEYVQYGYNKESEALPQLNLAYVYGVQSQLPILYRHLAGNVPDVKTLSWLLSLVDGLPSERLSWVMDRGFYSKENILSLLKAQRHFIMGTRMSLKYVKETLQAMDGSFDQFQYYDSVHQVYARSQVLTQTFKGSASAYYPVTLHIYYDRQRAAEERERFDRRLAAWQDIITQSPERFQDNKAMQRYFKPSDHGFEVKWETIEDHKQYLGYFALLTDQRLSSQDVLSLYRRKDVIEKAFGNIKERLNMRRMHVSSHRSLEGKLFVQHLALILLAYIQREMRASGLDQRYTVEDVLDEVNRIEGYFDEEMGLTVGEILTKQVEIFEALKITPPA